MKKQELRSLMMLCLLFLLGLVYSAHVFVIDTKKATETVVTDSSDEAKEGGEENVKETSHHFYLQEKMRYHLKPATSIAVKINADIEASLPETYPQLNTPPPDFA